MKIYEYNISLEVMFQALSSPVRVKIVQLLGAGPLCVGSISNRLGISQSAVSQHLRVLRLAGIVQAEKHGKHIHYSLRLDALNTLRMFFRTLCGCKGKDNCCGNH